jgi:hypothetical protein
VSSRPIDDVDPTYAGHALRATTIAKFNVARRTDQSHAAAAR